MWRFVAVLGLADIGIVLFLGFADLIQRCALVAAFGAAAMLPAVMNPTRHWARGFFRCFDLVYAAIVVYPVSRVEIFTAGLIPGLLFGTMASLGVGRSWLADFGSSRRS